MNFHFITHCYAVELPHYAKLLRMHLAEFANTPSGIFVDVSVCCCLQDTETVHVMEEMRRVVDCVAFYMPLTWLGRRAIGRNTLASKPHSPPYDAVVFSDVDYLWTFDAILGISKNVGRFNEANLIYPREVLISETHEDGDRVTATGDWCWGKYVAKGYNRAIGGCQIVSGVYARNHGYLRSTNWQQPTETPFKCFRDDIAFRRQCQTSLGVNIPGVYRIRHSTTSYQ